MEKRNHTQGIDNPLDVMVIGAGFSGVCAGIKLLEAGISNFLIFEKSDAVGGTWFDNTYPGAACDVPSHFYCYSFEPNPNWSRVYSPQAEILKYIESCVDKYHLHPHIRNGSKITSLTFNQETGLWLVDFEEGKSVHARHIINGFGGLHKPSIPEFTGLDSFNGPTMHTAQWDHSVSFENKNIAVIGSAASAIQVIPELAKVASTLTIFQRTPNYIAPRWDRHYSEKEKQRFSRRQWWHRLYRWFIYKRLDLILYPITRQGSKAGKIGRKRVLQHMRDSINDAAVREKFEPHYAMGCKRILLSDDLFDAVNKGNVVLASEGIEKIEEHGIRDKDGELHDADIIVFATGFDIDGHILSIEVSGSDGKSLAEEWREGPEAYCGSCIAGFPNYWMVTGPNTGVGTTSVVYMIEQSVQFIIRMIRAGGINSLKTVKRTAQDAFNADIRAGLAQSVWASGCDSWYITETGKITTLYPFNAAAFKKQLEESGLEDFDVVDSIADNKVA